MRALDGIEFGGLTLRNRLLMAPVKTALAAKGGAVTDELIAYYRRRAVGGVAAIIVEPMFVDPRGKEHPRQLSAHTDEAIPGLRQLVDAIHAEGAQAIAHLNHAGRAANPRASGARPEAPSAVPCPTSGATPEVMTSARVEQLVDAFAHAAARAHAAGFDAIELQAGLGYLLAQFWSPRTNQRNDEWGGDEAGRRRFAERVVLDIRDAVNDELPIIARVSGDEKVAGGIDPGCARIMARALTGWGVSALHVVSGSACDSPPWYYQHMSLPEGANEALAARIRQAVDAPIIVAGRLAEPEHIERVLVTGQADMVALGRPLVADPDLPRKLAEGRADQIVQCGACLQGCLASVKAGQPIGCIVNPEVGHEAQAPEPAEEPRHIVVVGGGPAGMSATIHARRRGHAVTLFERDTLGGQFKLAPLAPGKAGMGRPLDSLVRVTRACGADIREHHAATVEDVQRLAPDLVIVATGAEPATLPGLQDALTGSQVLMGDAEVGGRVLVVGGGLIGIEAAEHLHQRGHAVTVIEALDSVARDMEMITRKLTMRRLRGVEILTRARLEHIEDGVATVQVDGSQRTLGPFDAVVVAVGSRPVDELSAGLRAAGLRVEVAGDAAELGQIMGAVRAGWRVVGE